MRTPEEEHAFHMQRPDYAEWFNSRPVEIQAFVQRYPYDWYIIKKGAPYKLTHAGLVVELISYTEGKLVQVAAYEVGIRAYINPVWLEPHEQPLTHPKPR